MKTALLTILLLASATCLAFTIDGDTLTQEDEHAKITMTPHTCASPISKCEQTLTVTNKNNQSRNVNFAFLFREELRQGRVKEVMTASHPKMSRQQNCTSIVTGNGTINQCTSVLSANGSVDIPYLIDRTSSINHALYNLTHAYHGVFSINSTSTRTFVLDYQPNLNDSSGKFDLYLWLGTLQSPAWSMLVDPWWNNTFDYSRNYTIFNTHASRTIPAGHTVNITLDTASLIDVGKLQPDCGDLRVIYNDTIEIPWNNGTIDFPGECNIASTQVTFKLVNDILPNSNDTLYKLYHGNPFAPNHVRNLNATYLAYDDFDDGIINTELWNVTTRGMTLTETGGVLVQSASNNVSQYAFAYTNLTASAGLDASHPFSTRWKMRWKDSSVGERTYYGLRNITSPLLAENDSGTIANYHTMTAAQTLFRFYDDGTIILQTSTLTNDTNYTAELRSAGDTTSWYINDTLTNTTLGTWTGLQFFFGEPALTQNAREAYLDDFRVMKYSTDFSITYNGESTEDGGSGEEEGGGSSGGGSSGGGGASTTTTIIKGNTSSIIDFGGPLTNTVLSVPSTSQTVRTIKNKGNGDVVNGELNVTSPLSNYASARVCTDVALTDCSTSTVNLKAGQSAFLDVQFSQDETLGTGVEGFITITDADKAHELSVRIDRPPLYQAYHQVSNILGVTETIAAVLVYALAMLIAVVVAFAFLR